MYNSSRFRYTKSRLKKEIKLWRKFKKNSIVNVEWHFAINGVIKRGRA